MCVCVRVCVYVYVRWSEMWDLYEIEIDMGVRDGRVCWNAICVCEIYY